MDAAWFGVVLSVMVVVLFATIWAMAVVDWCHYRDRRALVATIAAALLAIATLGILGVALQRVGIITADARTFLVYVVRGSLLLGGILILANRGRR